MSKRTYGFKAHCEIAKLMADYYRAHTGDAAFAALHHLGDAIREATKAYWRETHGRHKLESTITVRSAEARKQYAARHKEHAVPVACLIDQIKNDRNITSLDIERIVRTHTHFVHITNAEHSRLNKLFRVTMPPGWRLGCCPFSRYHAAEIKLEFDESGASRCTCEYDNVGVA